MQFIEDLYQMIIPRFQFTFANNLSSFLTLYLKIQKLEKWLHSLRPPFSILNAMLLANDISAYTFQRITDWNIQLYKLAWTAGLSRISLYLFHSRHFQFNFAARSWFTFHLIVKRREGRSSNSVTERFLAIFAPKLYGNRCPSRDRARKAYLRW